MEEPRILTRLADSFSGTDRFAHQAMATTFELFIAHSDGAYAEQAAWAAFEELDRIEKQLSRYIENSDVSRINNLPANTTLRISRDAFRCLQTAARIHRDTNGAFDVTVGLLVDLYRKGDTPPEEGMTLVRQRTGMHLLELDEMRHAVRLRASPLRIDLGGIGKGYAVDCMAATLRDWSIDSALIHGGHSSVLALSPSLGTEGWPVLLRFGSGKILARVALAEQSISGSSLRKGRHIIDPRTGRYAEGTLAAWCRGPDATATDGLSTAFMVMSPEETEAYCARHPDTAAIIIARGKRDTEGEQVLRFGDWAGATS
jgi:thiamine biosynthesis lipoprotein